MRGKKLVKLLAIGIFLFFCTLYLAQATGHHETANRRKAMMTEEAIRRFEEDVRDGVDIDHINYLEQERNYQNRLTRMGRGLSSFIERSFNTIMSNIFQEIEKAVHND